MLPMLISLPAGSRDAELAMMAHELRVAACEGRTAAVEARAGQLARYPAVSLDGLMVKARAAAIAAGATCAGSLRDRLSDAITVSILADLADIAADHEAALAMGDAA